MANLTISERAYQKLQALAKQRGEAPEEVLEDLLGIEDDAGKIYDTLDDFFRSLGLSQQAIDRVNAQPDDADPSEYAPHISYAA